MLSTVKYYLLNYRFSSFCLVFRPKFVLKAFFSGQLIAVNGLWPSMLLVKYPRHHFVSILLASLILQRPFFFVRTLSFYKSDFYAAKKKFHLFRLKFSLDSFFPVSKRPIKTDHFLVIEFKVDTNHQIHRLSNMKLKIFSLTGLMTVFSFI